MEKKSLAMTATAWNLYLFYNKTIYPPSYGSILSQFTICLLDLYRMALFNSYILENIKSPTPFPPDEILAFVQDILSSNRI